MFREGKLDDREVEISIPIKIFAHTGYVPNNPNDDIDNNVWICYQIFFLIRKKRER